MKRMYVSNKDESVRMFKSDFLESLSKVHFTVPLIVFVPIVSYLFYLGITNHWTGIGTFLLCMITGFFVWTVIEYVMHRWVFHYHPSSEIGKKIHFIMHGVHHDYPNDSKRLVLPPSVSLPLATIFFFLFKSIVPVEYFYPFFASFLIGYLTYDMLHYAIHHVHFKGKLWNILKTHHIKHHYTDDTKGYGVSSPVWDLIIGSDFDKMPKTKNNETKKTPAESTNE